MFMRFVFIYLLLASCALSQSASATAQIENVLLTASVEKTKVNVKLSKPPKFSYFSLSNPQRLVLDLVDVKDNFQFEQIANRSSLVKKIRYSSPKRAGDARIVLELIKAVDTRVFHQQSPGTEQHTLVIELSDPNPDAGQVRQPILDRDEDILIVIDAGHGGADPGSVGPAGTYEKHITLSISKMLARLIDDEPGMRAIMTRTGDYYISPNDRPDVAVKQKADLLMSIHADAFTTPQPRGGSVWVLSNGRANSELGRLLEKKERSSELIGSAAEVIEDRDTERFFAETIFNMQMDRARASSYDFSNKVISEMKQITKMHKRAPQSASLAVLTAPETPSVLVEVGFISNPQEEKNLNWKAYREKMAAALFRSVKRYFSLHPPEGTTWAKNKVNAPVIHRVVSGESLSVIAARYQVSVNALKSTNGLRSSVLQVGQELTIPN